MSGHTEFSGSEVAQVMWKYPLGALSEPALSVIYPVLEMQKHINQNINGDTGIRLGNNSCWGIPGKFHGTGMLGLS